MSAVPVPGGVAYVDASAFVKLVVPETETPALKRALGGGQVLASSALLEVEAVIAARRRDRGAVPAAQVLLQTVELIEIHQPIRRAAAGLPDPGLRSLDAVHLATALSLGDRCAAFFCYDERLAAAARAHGLAVSVPAP